MYLKVSEQLYKLLNISQKGCDRNPKVQCILHFVGRYKYIFSVIVQAGTNYYSESVISMSLAEELQQLTPRHSEHLLNIVIRVFGNYNLSCRIYHFCSCI